MLSQIQSEAGSIPVPNLCNIAIKMLEPAVERYHSRRQRKRIQLRHLSRDCHRLLTKAGHLVIDSDDDPDYALAVNYSVKTGIIDGGH